MGSMDLGRENVEEDGTVDVVSYRQRRMLLFTYVEGARNNRWR
jgi:hypothetical protein